MFQLYQALHPEDKTATEKNIKIVTLTSVLLERAYNDLSFMVGNRLIILIEAQSTWSPNILLRLLIYFVSNLKDYISENNLKIYGSKAVDIPKPEFYVIYTGESEKHPETLKLRDTFFKGDTSQLDMTVKMIYAGKENDIIAQYIGFVEVFATQVKRYTRSKRAITETIRICKDNNLLKEFLQEHEKEVFEMADDFLTRERALNDYIEEQKELAVEAAQKAAQKAAKETAERTAKKLYETGMKSSTIASVLDCPVSTVRKWVGAT